MTITPETLPARPGVALGSSDDTAHREGHRSLRLTGAMVVTNLSTRPNPTTTVGGWTAGGAAGAYTSARVTDVVRRPGTASVRYNAILGGPGIGTDTIGSGLHVGQFSSLDAARVAVTPGVEYTMSIFYRCSVADARYNFNYLGHDDQGNPIGAIINQPVQTTTAPANQWTRVSWTITPAPGVVRIRPGFVGRMSVGGTVDGSEFFWITDFQMEEGDTATAFFDGDIPSSDAYQFAWTGTPQASPSTMISLGAETRRNLVQRPNPTGQTGGWASNNNANWTVTRDNTFVRRPGTWSVQATPTAAGLAQFAFVSQLGALGGTVTTRTPASPNTVYTVSTWHAANLAAYQTRFQIMWYDASNTLIGSTVLQPLQSISGPANTWRRLTYTTAASPANTALVNIVIVMQPTSGNTTGTEVGWLTDVQMEIGATATDYFDGDTADEADHVYRWTGTHNASHSVELARTPLDAAPAILAASDRAPLMDLAAGDEVTWASWVQIPADSEVGDDALTLDGTAFAAPVPIPTPAERDDWVQVYGTGTVTNPAGSVLPMLHGPARSGDFIRFDDMGLSIGDEPVDFSGDTPRAGPDRFRWSGGRGNSPSQRYIITTGIMPLPAPVPPHPPTPAADSTADTTGSG